VPAVLLFGIPDKKDAKASGAYAKNGIVQQAVRLLKKELPSLLVITDVCLCEYMEHGHCGIVSRGKILNDATLKSLSQTALSHAEAGADIEAIGLLGLDQGRGDDSTEVAAREVLLERASIDRDLAATRLEDHACDRRLALAGAAISRGICHLVRPFPSFATAAAQAAAPRADAGRRRTA